MEILSKNQLIAYLLKYTSAPADKPLMVWCGSLQSMTDLFDTLSRGKKFMPSGKVSEFEHYLPDGSTFAINMTYVESLNSKNIGVCTSFVRETHMPLVFLANDYQIPGEAKRPESPYRWGTDYDIEDIEELMPTSVKDEFIQVCYKPLLIEYIGDLKSNKHWEDILPIFIDYASSKLSLNYIDPYFLNELFKSAYIFCREALILREIKGDKSDAFTKEQNEKKLAGKPFTAEAAERRKETYLNYNRNVPRALTEDFIDFLEGTSAAWLFDSTKPHPVPHEF